MAPLTATRLSDVAVTGALLWHVDSAAPQELSGLVRLQRTRKVEALREVAVHCLEKRDLLGLFDPLRDDAEAQGVGKPYDRLDDCGSATAMSKWCDERPVDLELVDL